MQRFRLQDILRGALLLAVFAGIFLTIRQIGVDRLQAIVDSVGPFGPLAYIVLRATAAVLAPFGSGPLQLASGVLFGLWPAVFYSAVGSTLGYSVSFLIAARYGRDIVERLVGSNIERVDSFLDRLDDWRWLVFARTVLYFAYDFIAYAAGLSKIRYAIFILVTFVFGIPSIFVTIAIGLLAAGDLSLPFLG